MKNIKNNKKSRKAQMKVKQMVFVLIAVTMLLSMVGLFVMQIRANNLITSASEIEEENAKLLVAKLANSPEFSCENSFGSAKGTCVDFDKVMVLRNNISMYKDFWGVNQIEIRIIHSFEWNFGDEVECEYDFETREGNYPRCNYVRVMNESAKGNDYFSYVSVCKRRIINSGDNGQIVCNLGKLIVRYEDVKL